MKRINWISLKLLLITGITSIGILLTFLVVRASVQNDMVTDLNERLTQQGVPVQSITVQSRIPFQIEIVLETFSDATRITPEDSWHKHLAFREAALSYRFGFRLHSFTLVLVNAQGETVDWDQTYLHPESPSQQPFLSDPSKLDNDATEQLVLEQLDFYGTTVDELKVSTGAGVRNDVQTLEIRLSAPDLLAANKAIPGFMASLFSLLYDINDESEATQIAICRVWIVDDTDQILLRYLYDLEVGRHTWGIADGVTKDWFPHPEPEHTTFTPTAVPPAYPPPSPNPTSYP